MRPEPLDCPYVSGARRGCDQGGVCYCVEKPTAAASYDYPSTWTHVQRGGYGFTLRTPCRVVKAGPKRVQIATPSTIGGGERLRWVPREKVTTNG